MMPQLTYTSFRKGIGDIIRLVGMPLDEPEIVNLNSPTRQFDESLGELVNHLNQTKHIKQEEVVPELIAKLYQEFERRYVRRQDGTEFILRITSV